MAWLVLYFATRIWPSGDWECWPRTLTGAQMVVLFAPTGALPEGSLLDLDHPNPFPQAMAALSGCQSTFNRVFYRPG